MAVIQKAIMKQEGTIDMNRTDCLELAFNAIKDRGARYGTPEANFKRIAKLWSVYKNVPFTVKDVGMMMTLPKERGRRKPPLPKARARENHPDLLAPRTK